MTAMSINASLHRSLLSPYRIACASALRGRILDVGGGLGDYLPYFNGEVVLADVSHQALCEAPIAARVQASGERLPFRDSCFDAAWACAVAQYLDLTRFVAELMRVTRHGGRIMLLVPNGRSPWDPIKRWLGYETWAEQAGTVRQYTVDDLAVLGQVTGEIRFLPGEGLLRTWPRLGHTLMLDITVAK